MTNDVMELMDFFHGLNLNPHGLNLNPHGLNPHGLNLNPDLRISYISSLIRSFGLSFNVTANKSHVSGFKNGTPFYTGRTVRWGRRVGWGRSEI
jgi:hypothetical protein